MAEITEQQILEALSDVKDPDTGNDIVSVGMVTGVQIKDGHVAFAIEVDPVRGGQLEPLRKEAEQTVHALSGVLTATVVLTAERAGGQTHPAPQSQPAESTSGQQGSAAQGMAGQGSAWLGRAGQGLQGQAGGRACRSSGRAE